jgi:hypothetical protein
VTPTGPTAIAVCQEPHRCRSPRHDDQPTSPANIIIAALLSLVGLAAFEFGKQNAGARPLVVGVLLMPSYFIPSTWLLFLVACLLTALIFHPR